ncbi:MAG: hypothetical protein CMJ50_02315 [Planctomycetaceae bacterium]|jgi:hypothetical protein|nr:hypothetical protein [Planctomycetaceae bacterium]
MMTTIPTTPERWQFSLRTSLAVMTLTCVGGAVVHYLRWSIIPLKELTFASIFALVLVLTFVLAGEFVGWLVTRLSAKRPEQKGWRRCLVGQRQFHR